jgi:hypothetical protein
MRYNPLIYFIYISILLFSCKSERFKDQPTNALPNISFLNMGKDLHRLSSDQYQLFENREASKYGDCYPYFVGFCLKIGNPGDSSIASGLKAFYSDKYIVRLENKIAQDFKNTSTIERKISTAFQRLEFFLPKAKLPKKIVFMNTLFTASVNAMDDDIAIGLERYLGPNTDVIKELPEQQFFQWIKVKMLPEFLERDVMTAWIKTHIVTQKGTNTIDEIVNWGKILYLADIALNNENKSILMRYSKKEFDWATKSEIPFWKYLQQESLLFTSNERTSQNLLQDAPFTAGLPEKGADRLGQFLGWKIVTAFMNEKDEVSLQQLIDTPYNEILLAYKPK